MSFNMGIYELIILKYFEWRYGETFLQNEVAKVLETGLSNGTLNSHCPPQTHPTHQHYAPIPTPDLPPCHP